MSNSNSMNTILIENQPITYTIRYQKNRKSIQLKLTSVNHLNITAPTNFPIKEIEKIILKKTKWIIAQISKLATVASNPINKSISHNARILYLGTPYTLTFTIKENQQPAVHLEEDQILLELPPLSAANLDNLSFSLLKKWYLDSAMKILTEKTNFWSALIKVSPKRITIKEQKTRWGSCSSRGNVNYNWRIIMAPLEVVDYLVIHELCHLHILNHSDSFWREVEKYSPNYKGHRTWLRTNGRLLMNIL